MPRLPEGKPNDYYVNQRAPLSPSPLQKLPAGSVRGAGWVKVQLDLQREGFMGHLAEISRYLNPKNNAWMGTGDLNRGGWEELPYWLKGQVSLGYVTHDKKIIAEVAPWIQAIIASQKADGWFGPESNRKTKYNTPDLWPNMLAQNVLQTYYEATGDQRVITLMSKYCDYLISLSDASLFDKRHYWHYLRVGDQLASLVWLYNQTGDPKIVKLATRIHHAGAKWVDGVANAHGVNFGQGFREPATYSLFSKQKADWEATERDLREFTGEYGQMPGGMYGADENARKGKTDPRQAAESCAIAEMMYSHELLLEYSGDPKWADKAEDVTFNWMPVTMTSNLKAIRYLQAGNMAISDEPSKSPGVENGGPMFLMDPNDHRCCQHNVGMGWPYFTEHLWFATDDNGLVAAILAPSIVTAKAGDGTVVSIREDTNYPFEDTIRFRVTPEKMVAFPFSIRIPNWAVGATVSVNGKPSPKVVSGGYVRIDRTWKKNDVVTLTLPMKVETRTWSQRPGSLSVYRGPLAYSLKINEQYDQKPRPNGWNAYEILPTTAWNYGLNPNPKFTVKQSELRPGIQPWDLRFVPISLQTTGRKVPEWTFDMYELVSPLQQMPVYTNQPEEKIELVPMGAARLRITVFPTVTTAATGAHWTKPREARKSIPAKYSWRNWWDSEAALSDGLLPKSANDHEIPRFTWWDHKGTEEWVQYIFDANRTFQSCRIYWFDDGKDGFCRVPESWKIQVKVADKWQDVEPLTQASNEKDGWSTIKFKPVAGTEIRLVAKLKQGFSAGILEWEVE